MPGTAGGDPMWGLRELPLPDSVSWMPQTYGWGVLCLLVALGLAFLIRRQCVTWGKRAYRRLAIAELTRIGNDDSQLHRLPALLRRTALSGFPREEVVSLRGRAWTKWLNDHGARFIDEDADALDRLAYDPQLAEKLAPETAKRLIVESRKFVRSHRARI